MLCPKYEGLDGTELAISESQERMAVVVGAEDVERFKELAYGENLEATVVAEVKAEPRLIMHWNGKNIVNISREFLDSMVQKSTFPLLLGHQGHYKENSYKF